MALTLANILDRVLDECGFAREAAYVAGTTVAARQLVALANRSALSLRTMPFTRRRATGTIAMTTATSYSLPSDFFEYIPDTAFMDGDSNPVVWPTPEEVWALYENGGITPAGALYVRQMAGALKVLNPVNGTDLLFEYLSNAVIRATSAGAYKERFTVDTDEFQLDDELIVLDVKWRFKKEKGIADWQTDLQEFSVYVKNALGRDFGAMTFTPGVSQYPGEPYTNLWVS